MRETGRNKRPSEFFLALSCSVKQTYRIDPERGHRPAGYTASLFFGFLIYVETP
jgi:hypothetical protein